MFVEQAAGGISLQEIVREIEGIVATNTDLVLKLHETVAETLGRSLGEALGIDPADCVYCGRPKTDSDHFRAIVRGGRPSGYFHTPDNIVPACGSCNQSKGGLDWRAWMNGPAKGSPTTKKISDVSERTARLVNFEANAGAVQFSPDELRDIVSADLWDRYWKRLDALYEDMKAAQVESEVIRDRLQAAYEARSELRRTSPNHFGCES